MEKKNFKWKMLCLTILALLICISFHIISVISWLNYREIIYVIFVIGKYAFAAGAIVFSILFLSQNAKGLNKVKKICFSIVLFLINTITLVFLLLEFGMHVTAVSNIIDVSSEDSSPYIVVKNHAQNILVKIQCDKEVREKIVVDEQVLYEMDYRYIKGRELEAVLGNITLQEPVDNTRKKEMKEEGKEENKEAEKETEIKMENFSLEDAFRDKQSVIILEGEVKFPIGEIQEIIVGEKGNQEKNVEVEPEKVKEFIQELENVQSHSDLTETDERAIQNNYVGIDIRFVYKTEIGEILIIHVQSIGANYHIVHVEKQDENLGTREWILVNQSEGNTQKAAYVYSEKLSDMVKNIKK